MGQFEEEDEGIGAASDVVKLEGEDPATPDFSRQNCSMIFCFRIFFKCEEMVRTFAFSCSQNAS